MAPLLGGSRGARRMRAGPALTLVTALAAALAGCNGSTGTGGGRAPGTPATCLPGCPATRGYDALSYALTGSFDWAANRVEGSEAITLALPAGAAPVVELDAALTVRGVRAGAQQLAWSWSADRLAVDLTPLAPGTAPVTFTVDYLAAASGSLIPTSSVTADPVRSRVVFTDSEPRGGHRWLVEKDDPSDRALFSVELTVAAGEDVVANGERVTDVAGAGGRRVGYALDVPIPTYLMAFAAGQLTHVDRAAASGVPLSLWYRQGLAVEPGDSLDALDAAMSHFEALPGPYPFARYSLVLLPGYGGGMENATITFEGEAFSQAPYATGLHTHELAHHWFGNLVTMHGYDDVWVKEGMATLLAAEADRPSTDRAGLGRLNASSFSFNPADAILDPTLTGLAKYTSGPYERSAALLTQVRALLGETVFWARAREFLAAHAWGSATGEAFVRAFSPELTEPRIQQVLAILPRFDVPTFAATVTPGSGATRVELTLSDPFDQVLVPYRLTVVDPSGAAATHELTAASPLAVDLLDGGYLAPDEPEVQPDDPVTADLFAALAPYLQPVPGTPAASTFAARSAAHQERALGWYPFYGATPGQLAAYVDALGSDWAALYPLWSLCLQVGSTTRPMAPADQAAWIAAMTPIFDAPRRTWPFPANLRCGPALGAHFLAELEALSSGTPPSRMGRLEYLLWFDYGAAGATPLNRVASSAPSLRLRQEAATRLTTLPPALMGAAPAPSAPAAAAAWRAERTPRASELEGKGARGTAGP